MLAKAQQHWQEQKRAEGPIVDFKSNNRRYPALPVRLFQD